MPIHFDTPERSKPNFARWLIAQKAREDMIGDLAKAASRDPAYPLDGDHDAVSARLNQLSAESEMHIALDDAELDWLAQ